MVVAWEDTDDVTTLAYEAGFDPELLVFMEERNIRFQILDGALLVNPPPGFRHERLVIPLGAQIMRCAPPEIAVLGSGYKFFYDRPSCVMADITVARVEDCREAGTFVAPLLVVEILSPSTRRTDLTRKREIYAEAGVPMYWVVDPVEPRLTVLTLDGGRYDETATVAEGGELVVQEPFPMSFVPFPEFSR